MRPAFITWAAVLILAACNAGSQPANLANVRISGIDAAQSAPSPSANKIKTWISPEARAARRVLFVSDLGSKSVEIFKLPSLKLVGQLSGFNFPEGECSDKRGNIWVTDEYAQQLDELSHAGSIIKTLSDPTGYPVSCAIDPNSGDLAVTNKVDLNSAAGGIEIYAGASGHPTEVRNPNQYLYYFDGYDDAGNIFVDGLAGSGPPGVFILSECLAGHSTCSTVKVRHGSIVFPGMAVWYAPGGDLIVGDQECPAPRFATCPRPPSTRRVASTSPAPTTSISAPRRRR